MNKPVVFEEFEFESGVDNTGFGTFNNFDRFIGFPFGFADSKSWKNFSLGKFE